MNRKVIIYLLLFVVPFYCSCSSLQKIPKENWKTLQSHLDKSEEIFVTTKDSSIYILPMEEVILTEDSLYGKGIRQFAIWNEYEFEGAINIDEIVVIKGYEFDLTNTIFLGLGLLFIITLLLTLGGQGMKEAAGGISL